MENVKIYNKQELIKKLANENFYCDEVALGNYFRELKIEAIFENGEGVEFYDEDAFIRILNFLNERNKMYSQEESKAPSQVQTEAPVEKRVEQTQIQEIKAPQEVQPQQAFVQDNSFKLDISEKTLNMIARVISKKIAKQVNNMLSPDNLKDSNLTLFIEENKRLSARVKILEEENEYLRRDLRDIKESYTPSWFGLYKYTGNKKDR